MQQSYRGHLSHSVHYITGLIIFALLVSIIPTNTASAQESSSISISPLRQEETIAPGFVYSGSLLIKNTGNQTKQIALSTETFAVTNQTYDYVFKPETNETKWVKFNKDEITLEPNNSQVINYEVNVPNDAEPGGYYLALFALNQTASNGAGISPTERVASLLYLTVSGEASRSGKLIQLRYPGIVFGDSSWSATLQNDGTLHYRTTYTAKLSSIFNNDIQITEDSRLILPNSVRLIEGKIPTPSILGIYKVNFTVSLGDSPAYTETRWIVYLPPLQLVLVLLILIGCFIIIKQRRTI